MKTYIGTKIIKAKPMTKKEYCDYRGWGVPPDEDPNEDVYLVEYPEDPKSDRNHANHKGYISMSPKHVFDKAYKVADTYMDRLIIERDDLVIKIGKLSNSLIKETVPDSAREILTEQGYIMGEYLDILNKRIG